MDKGAESFLGVPNGSSALIVDMLRLSPLLPILIESISIFIEF